jgi:hypothetical protein
LLNPLDRVVLNRCWFLTVTADLLLAVVMMRCAGSREGVVRPLHDDHRFVHLIASLFHRTRVVSHTETRKQWRRVLIVCSGYENVFLMADFVCEGERG